MNNEEDVVVCTGDDRVPQDNSFRYLSSIIRNENIVENVMHRIKVGDEGLPQNYCLTRRYL